MKNKIDLTVVCVYNDTVILEKHLKSSLLKQTVDVEIILLDNHQNVYPSAASALQYGACEVKTTYVMFVHQDIEFLKDSCLEDIYSYLDKNNKTIIGSAGVKIGTSGVFSSMVHGENKEAAGANFIQDAYQVDVVDECLLACSTTIFAKIGFDEIVCNGWDLYVVDFCLRAKQLYNVVILPLRVWHVSPGDPKHAFYDCARRLCKKYRNTHIKSLQSCCITVPIKIGVLSSAILMGLEVRHSIREQIKLWKK